MPRSEPSFALEQPAVSREYTPYSRSVKNVRFHNLRRTFGVNSLKAGDDVNTVQENLGHHTAAFTLDVYAHVTSGMKQESASRMEKYLRSVTD